jgi:hypothetical protein
MKDAIAPTRQRSLFWRSTYIICLLVAGCSSVFGQNGNATISGTVQDPSGAVVVGAQVSVTNG